MVKEPPMKMPFGRHKGKEISEIPPDYLEWISDNLTISGDLADEIYRVLGTGPDPEHIQRCRAALVEMASTLTDKQVMQLYGYAEWMLSADRLP
jgi:hypothetical protein